MKFHESVHGGPCVEAMALEYVAAVDMQAALRASGPLAMREAETVLCHAGSGLAFLHKQGFLHLDFKTKNLLLRQADCRVWVIDLGMCEPIGSENPQFETYATRHVRPPELFVARPTGTLLHPAADVWSFGCVVYEVASGKCLFEDKRLLQTWCKAFSGAVSDCHQKHDAKRTVQAHLACIGAWGGVVLRCCKPKPTDRPGFALGMSALLRKWRAI